jgi:hypothetical protein
VKWTRSTHRSPSHNLLFLFVRVEPSCFSCKPYGGAIFFDLLVDGSVGGAAMACGGADGGRGTNAMWSEWGGPRSRSQYAAIKAESKVPSRSVPARPFAHFRRRACTARSAQPPPTGLSPSLPFPHTNAAKTSHVQSQQHGFRGLFGWFASS